MPNKRPEILADVRESRSGVIDVLHRRGKVAVHVEMLEVGDYSISDQVLIERKQAADFAQSIMSGRLACQIALMKAVCPRPVLIVEGTLQDQEHICDREVLLGSLAWLIMQGVSLTSSASLLHSAMLIECMARQAQSVNGHGPSMRGGKPRDTGVLARFVVEGLPGCGAAASRRLLQHFGSVEAVMRATAEELAMVPGIGEKTARRIREVLTHQGTVPTEPEATCDVETGWLC